MSKGNIDGLPYPMTPSSTKSRRRTKVLLVENIHPSAHPIFGEGFEIEAIAHSPKEDELRALVRDVDVLGIRSKTRVTAPVLAEAKSLLALGCFCIGTNQVDLVEANKRGVPVFN